MPKRKKQSEEKHDDMTVGELAKMVNSAFIKQGEMFTQQFEQQKTELLAAMKDQKEEILAEIDSRDYVTKHDLNDAIVDAKDEILEHIDRAVAPKLQDHEKRLTKLEQRVR